jgi:hypothetical protein
VSCGAKKIFKAGLAVLLSPRGDKTLLFNYNREPAHKNRLDFPAYWTANRLSGGMTCWLWRITGYTVSCMDLAWLLVAFCPTSCAAAPAWNGELDL